MRAILLHIESPSYVVPSTVQNIILSLSAFTPSFLTTQYMVDPFSPYAQLSPLKAFHHTVS